MNHHTSLTALLCLILSAVAFNGLINNTTFIGTSSAKTSSASRTISSAGHQDPMIVATFTDSRGVRHQISMIELKVAQQIAPPSQNLSQTLTDLIELNLLSEEARRLGYDQHPAALDERARRAVEHFVIDDFHKTHRLETLPPQFIEQSTQKNIGLFKHPELRRGTHLLIKPMGSEKTPMTEEQEETLKPVIDRARADLIAAPIHSSAELEEKLKRYQPWLPEGYEVIFEDLGRFSRHGPFIPSFNEACFAIDEAPRLVGPTLTPFGFHFIWIEEVIPPLVTSDEEIEEIVRRRLLPEVRGFEWRKLLTRLFKQQSE